MDPFFRVLPYNMKRAVSLRTPQTSDLLGAVEKHQNTEALLKGCRPRPGTVEGDPTTITPQFDSQPG